MWGPALTVLLEQRLREPRGLPGPELREQPVRVRPAWGRDAVRQALPPTATVRRALPRGEPPERLRRSRTWFLLRLPTGTTPADDGRRAPPLWMTQTSRTRLAP